MKSKNLKNSQFHKRPRGNDSLKASGHKILSIFKAYPCGLNVIIPALLSVIAVSILVLALGAEVRNLLDTPYNPENNTLKLWALVSLFALLGLLSSGSFARSYYVSNLGEKLALVMRQKLYDHTLSLDVSFFDSLRAGEIIARLTTDVDMIQSVVSNSVALGLRNTLLFLGGLTMMIYTSPTLTLYTLLIIPFVMVPIILFGRRVKQYALKAQDIMAGLSGFMDETINHIRTLQAFTHEPLDRGYFAAASQLNFDLTQKRNRARALLSALVMMSVGTGVMVMFWVGSNTVNTESLTSGELTSFIIYACLSGATLNAFSEIMGDLSRAAAAFDRIQELAHIRPSPWGIPIPLKG